MRTLVLLLIIVSIIIVLLGVLYYMTPADDSSSKATPTTTTGSANANANANDNANDNANAKTASAPAASTETKPEYLPLSDTNFADANGTYNLPTTEHTEAAAKALCSSSSDCMGYNSHWYPVHKDILTKNKNARKTWPDMTFYIKPEFKPLADTLKPVPKGTW